MTRSGAVFDSGRGHCGFRKFLAASVGYWWIRSVSRCFVCLSEVAGVDVAPAVLVWVNRLVAAGFWWLLADITT